MLSSFRRLSKSKLGTGILILFLLTVLASFALGDIKQLTGGAGGLSQGTLASVGSARVTDVDFQKFVDRQVARAREQKPNATAADLAPDFDAMIDALLQQRTLEAYAAKHGLVVSKRLVDAELAQLPGVQGLDGKFSEASYQQFLQRNRLTDVEVRREITNGLLQRLILTPIAANTRIPLGVARPYASMLLEQREGEVALVPTAAFRAGPAPTDAEVQAYYKNNQSRYVLPEQRVLRIARIGTAQLTGAAPTDAEIAAYYKANEATYGNGEQRVISRAVVPDRNAAQALADRARSATFASAAAPAGFSAADVSVGPQTRAQLEQLAGKTVADQAFAAASGTIVGPVQSDLGWNVVMVESIQARSGKTLDQARAEIVAKLTADKSKEAMADLVGRIEDAIAGGQNFAEAAAAFKLPVSQTPPLTANGQSRDPAFKLPTEYAGLVRAGFDASSDDDPTVETLPGDAGYALLAVGDVTPSAAVPLASIRDRVSADLVARRAEDRAKAVATAIAAKVSSGTSLADAIRGAGVAGLPAPQALTVKRVQLSQLGDNIPAPLQMLFTLPNGGARMIAAPQGQGFFVVHNKRITPGDASTQPTLVAQVQGEFNRATSQELALQFLAAAQKELGVKRDEAAIAAIKKRLATGS